MRGVDEDGEDVLLRGDCQEEDTSKGGDDLGDERGPVDGGVAGVLELVAERRAAQEVDVVGPGEVARVRDVANGARKLTGEVLAQLVNLVGAGGFVVCVKVAVCAVCAVLLLLGLPVLLVLLVLLVVLVAGGLCGARHGDSGYAALAEVSAGVDVGRAAILSRSIGLVEAAEALFGFGEMAVVEGV